MQLNINFTIFRVWHSIISTLEMKWFAKSRESNSRILEALGRFDWDVTPPSTREDDTGLVYSES